MRKTGFTLIELLIVVAIIGILAGVILVSTSGGKNKANAAATKTTLSTLKSAIAQCCSNVGNTVLSYADGGGGGAICSASSTTENYPTAAALKLNAGGTVAYTGVSCSASNPIISIVLTGHPDANCNTTPWTLDPFGKMIPPVGC